METTVFFSLCDLIYNIFEKFDKMELIKIV